MKSIIGGKIMSHTLKIARLGAVDFVKEITPYCSKISIAGSIRREQLMVKDIEIVCIAKMGIVEYKEPSPLGKFIGQAFTTKEKQENLLFNHLNMLEKKQTIKFTKNGPKMKSFSYYFNALEIQIDLFTATPDNWGVIYMIRTGSKKYNIAFMNAINKKGEYKIDEGWLWSKHTKQKINCRTEERLFEVVNIPWKDPWEREGKVY